MIPLRLMTLGVGALASPRYAPVGLLLERAGIRVMIDGGPGAAPRGELDAWLVTDDKSELMPRIRELAGAQGLIPYAGHFKARGLVVECRAPVRLRAWRHVLRGRSGDGAPVYFLDTQLPENGAWDRSLTDHLYGGDDRYRLCQEAVLGLGGAEMLRALGHVNVWTYHMNEGHSALLALGLLEERMGARGLAAAGEADLGAVRERCVFTTHTPVPAGIDRFPLVLVASVLGRDRTAALETLGCCSTESPRLLNMTFLALFCSRYINGVSMRHDEVSQGMFPDYPINAITNGVHATTWTAPSFQALYDRHVPEWRHDNLYLRYAIDLPLEEVRAAHHEAKAALLTEVKRRTGRDLHPEWLTLGFARRATGYKRADLIFADLE